MNSLEVKHLTKAYRDFTLKDISFTLPSGTIMGLVGENGAGKSTTIRLIMDAIAADSGSVTVLGVSNRDSTFTAVKQDIGVVLDEAYFPEVLTPKNINRVLKRCYVNWNEDTFFHYIQRFSLPTDKKFKDFSRGMKMKLAIAAALSHEAKLLILDEATSGLDPMVREEILDVFNEFTRDENHSILLSSHIISDLEKICDYITFLHKGELVLSEEKDLLLERYVILKLTEEELGALPPQAVIRRKKTSFGFEILSDRNLLPATVPVEHTTLEDIILFLSKEC